MVKEFCGNPPTPRLLPAPTTTVYGSRAAYRPQSWPSRVGTVSRVSRPARGCAGRCPHTSQAGPPRSCPLLTFLSRCLTCMRGTHFRVNRAAFGYWNCHLLAMCSGRKPNMASTLGCTPGSSLPLGSAGDLCVSGMPLP